MSAEHAFLKHADADLPLGVYVRHQAANYIVALPSDGLLVLYTDGLTEHDRDPIRGEDELVEAARWAYDRPLLDPARAVAAYVLHRARGTDDAATLVLRLTDGALR
jgi:serine phosphatase RsbU (regulator of sigma subunit)